jgi:16S rRNA (guanine966-N2)-methyltransferase
MGRAKSQYIRVIAGEYRGRRLSCPSDRSLRPTMDRTRESLFASIQERVAGAGFADLFCAAGGVGIEALSRDADVVHFVEKSPVALDHLRQNLIACSVADQRYQIHARDVLEWVEDGGLDNPAIRVVFADPPYDGDQASRLLAHLGSKAYDHIDLLILEHREPVDEVSLGMLDFARSKRFGATLLSFWQRRR